MYDNGSAQRDFVVNGVPSRPSSFTWSIDSTGRLVLERSVGGNRVQLRTWTLLKSHGGGVNVLEIVSVPSDVSATVSVRVRWLNDLGPAVKS